MHALPAYGGQLAHLQPDRYFLSGTRPDRKWSESLCRLRAANSARLFYTLTGVDRTSTPVSLRQHRTIASASLRRLFAPLLQFGKPEIHTVFETAEKGLCPFSTKGLQSAARTPCPPTADNSHTCSLIGIFCQVQEVNCPEGARETTLGCAPTENGQNLFAACGRQTLRGFFDTLKYIQDSFVFQTLNWGKNPV